MTALAAEQENQFSRAIPWVAAALTLFVGVAIMSPFPVGVMHDDALYVVLAKSLATGHGYRWLQLPDAPTATHFPPGYPAVLALIWWLVPSFPANVVAFKLANACFAAVSAYLLATFVRERWSVGPIATLVFTAFSMLGIPALVLSSTVMSEPLFLMLLLIALRVAERVADGSERRPFVLLALAAFVGIMVLVRTHGVVLAAALPAVLLFRRRPREALVFFTVAAVMVMPWQLWVASQASAPPAMGGMYETYGSWLANGLRSDGPALLWRTALRTLPQSVAMFAPLVAPPIPVLRLAMLLVLGALTVIGVRPLWKGAPVTAIFLALYSAIVILWPFPPARFIWAIWPLVVLVPALGARDVFAWRPGGNAHRALRLTLMAGAVLLFAGHTRYNVRGYSGKWWASIPRNNAALLRSLVVWTSQRTPPNATVASEEESTIYLYTGRHAVPAGTFTAQQFFAPRTPIEDAAALRAILGHYSVDAVAVSAAPLRAAARQLSSGPDAVLALADSAPGVLVFTPNR